MTNAVIKRKPITANDIAAIKRVLCWPPSMPLPRCPAKSWSKATALSEQGDPSHLEAGHVCEKCRCGKTAGYGTRKNAHLHGDFYGLGEHTGHFGVGYCYAHEKYAVRSNSYAVAAMKAIQTQGEAGGPDQQWVRTLATEAELSADRISVRRGMDSVKRTLEEFERACKDGHCTLKEYSNGELGEMSDKSRIQLALQIAKVLSDTTKDVLHMERTDYIHRDQVKMAVFKTIDATLKLLPKEEDRKEWLTRFRDIWQRVKTGEQ